MFFLKTNEDTLFLRFCLSSTADGFIYYFDFQSLSIKKVDIKFNAHDMFLE
jgi:hypothetical protein